MRISDWSSDVCSSDLRYDKSISTRNRGQGTLIDAPILAFLIETRQGRVLFDVGCDYAKLSDPQLRARWFDPVEFPMGPPEMTEEQRLPAHLDRHGLSPADIDLVFLSRSEENTSELQSLMRISYAVFCL